MNPPLKERLYWTINDKLNWTLVRLAGLFIKLGFVKLGLKCVALGAKMLRSENLYLKKVCEENDIEFKEQQECQDGINKIIEETYDKEQLLK